MPGTDLKQYYKRLDLIRQTAEQIKKDFELFNISISFSGDPEHAYPELFNQIKPEIERLLSGNYNTLLQLLYRIDVSEKHLAEAMQNMNRHAMAVVITELVIQRELQKVLIRNAYKNEDSAGPELPSGYC